VPDLRALLARPPASPPPDALGVPLVRQETDFSCGPAALLAVLRYWGVDEGNEEHDLYGELHTTSVEGTEGGPMAAVARSRGLTAFAAAGAQRSDLEAALSEGGTVILNVQAPDPSDDPDDVDDGHFVVLMGADERGAYVMDPSLEGAYGFLSWPALEQRWHDLTRAGALVEGGVVVIFGDTPEGAVDAQANPVEAIA
jgi:predicted double-glycine peptidase